MRPEATAAVVRTRAEAEMMVHLLQSHGIAAGVSTDDAGGVEAALQAHGVRVLVPAADRARATALVDDSEPRPPQHLNALQRLVVRVLGGKPGPTST